MTSGESIAPYLKAFKTDLFLSANVDDVQDAINSGIAAGQILTGVAHADSKRKIDQIRIAFVVMQYFFRQKQKKYIKEKALKHSLNMRKITPILRWKKVRLQIF